MDVPNSEEIDRDLMPAAATTTVRDQDGTHPECRECWVDYPLEDERRLQRPLHGGPTILAPCVPFTALVSAHFVIVSGPSFSSWIDR
jgi:hypothetical protein